MPPHPSASSSLHADQAAAAGSLVRLLTDRFDTLPTADTTALAQTLLAQDGLVTDIQHLLRAISHWSGTTGPALYEGPLPFEVQDALGQAADQLAPLSALAKETTFPRSPSRRQPLSTTAAPVPRNPSVVPAEGAARRC
ncbi:MULTISPECIES: hypothetical protein [unclassified Streptomyces]|uniref:hypothetical protein n=1 Tax=unclassified Streptomyces TaxID=2593676 RepID=UPI000DC7A40C|nr:MULTISPECIES: hypothetical protein [unclassified Streptomyces]AWZ08348.1 hypothetical protein DRB89_31420 [Streptomyces sp. ICC4]AWZ16138.1 hypothetical protein DRB96_32225 [Streptomyces sp. ICC1]